MRILDLFGSARRARTRLRSENRPGRGTRADARLVQGGRLADVLGSPGCTDSRFWPVDTVILVYFAFTTLLILGWWGSMPDAWQHFVGHLTAMGLIVYEVKRPNRTSWIFRNWYPLPFVGASYKEMAILIHAI